jgi:aryl-alcohol dehydrogenase-like predicted oxidoreductase
MTREADTKFAKVAGTPLTISRIGLGTWAIGGWMWGGTDEEESIKTINAAVERGVSLIDTAPAYGFGRSEEIVGRAIAEGQLRSRVVIATKTGLEWKDGKVFRNAGCARILCEVADSLRRLRVPITSISTRCIGPTRWCRSKRPPKQCRRCSTKARSGLLA